MNEQTKNFSFAKMNATLGRVGICNYDLNNNPINKQNKPDCMII